MTDSKLSAMKRMRLYLGYSQQQFAELLEISQSHMCLVETGTKPLSNKLAHKLVALAKKKKYNLCIEDLIDF